MAAIGVLFSVFVQRVGGHPSHAENCLIKFVDDGVIVSVHGDVPDSGKHSRPPRGLFS
jgi:hypothetical protein